MTVVPDPAVVDIARQTETITFPAPCESISVNVSPDVPPVIDVGTGPPPDSAEATVMISSSLAFQENDAVVVVAPRAPPFVTPIRVAWLSGTATAYALRA